MSKPNRNTKLQSGLYKSWLWSLFVPLFALFTFLGGLISCGKKKVETEQLGHNLDSVYTMRTEGVDMLVSDSGLVKYRLLSTLWLVYDKPERKEWVFPEGIRLEGYDTVAPSQILVTADVATYDIADELWTLTGNVRIHGPNGERLYTPQLYWNRQSRRLYSNDTTYFLTQGRELHGDRFEALDDLSWYSIYNNRGIMEYEEREPEYTSAQ